MLADLMARIWDLHVRAVADELREAYAAFLLMRNLDEQIPGANLYLFKKRGIFKTAATRTTAPAPGVAARVSHNALPPDAIAEIEYRFAGLKRWALP